MLYYTVSSVKLDARLNLDLTGGRNKSIVTRAIIHPSQPVRKGASFLDWLYALTISALLGVYREIGCQNIFPGITHVISKHNLLTAWGGCCNIHDNPTFLEESAYLKAIASLEVMNNVYAGV